MFAGESGSRESARSSRASSTTTETSTLSDKFIGETSKFSLLLRSFHNPTVILFDKLIIRLSVSSFVYI